MIPSQRIPYHRREHPIIGRVQSIAYWFDGETIKLKILSAKAVF